MHVEHAVSDDKLSLCWGSMEGVALRDFVAAASGAGFGYVTLNSALYVEAMSLGFADAELHQLLQHHGLRVSNIDPLFNWLPGAVHLEGDDPIAVCSRATRQEVFHLAHVVGTDLVNAPLGMATPNSEQEIVDCFGSLCNSAAAEGLRISLEFMPFNQVGDLETASRIVNKAGCQNGGIMLDCWHHHRAGGTPADLLDVPGDSIFAVQMDDALPEPMEDLLQETLNHRRLPGGGCIDLLEIVANLRRIGAQVIYDVEVFDQAMRSLSPAQRAQQLFDSSSAVVRHD